MKKTNVACRELLLFAAAAFIFLLALILPAAFAFGAEITKDEEHLMNAVRHNQMVCVQVIANSDSTCDQIVKYHIRNAILKQHGQLIKSAAFSRNKTAFLLDAAAPVILKTARAAANGLDWHGDIAIDTGWLNFPQKHYRQSVIPEGKHYALRITLGDGAGKNWWSVLYPRLALQVSKYEGTGSELFFSSERILSQWLAFCN